MKYAIKRDKVTLDFFRGNTKIIDERYVYKSKLFDRYYVMSKYSCSDNIELFITEDFKKAKEILAVVHEVWTTDLYIVGINDDGTEVKID